VRRLEVVPDEVVNLLLAGVRCSECEDVLADVRIVLREILERGYLVSSD
jgi:hypothetical protein